MPCVMKRPTGTYTFEPRHSQSTYSILLRAAETIIIQFLHRYRFSNKHYKVSEWRITG
jgi:hypothetical protein